MRRRALLAAGPALLAGCGAWRSFPPAVAPTPDMRASPHTHDPLPSGASLWTLATPGATTQLELSLAAGAELDPPGRAGLTALALAALLDRRTRDELARHGAAPRARWAVDGGALACTVEAADAPAVARRLAQRLRDPALDDAGAAAAIAALQHEAARAAADPQRTAARTLDLQIFPADHPYAHRGAPTLAGLRGRTRGELADQLARSVDPRRLALIAAGDVPRPALRDALADVCAGWTAPSAPPPLALADVPAPPRAAVVVVPWPGADQAILAVGRAGLPALDPRAPQLDRLIDVVGAFVRARLRADRGVAYYVHAHHDAGRHGGALRLITQVDVDQAAASLRTIFWCFEHVQTLVLGPDWLAEQAAYDAVQRVYTQRADPLAAMARRHRLGGDPPAAPDLAHAARRLAEVQASHLRPSRLQVVCLADPARLRPQLDAARIPAALRARPGA
jgi:predicted Zn-dependent peptidase